MRKSSSRRVAVLTTASIVSFSLTLLVAGLAILSGLVPLPALADAQRSDLGTLLFIAALGILVITMVFEATLIALRTAPLPEPKLVRVDHWADTVDN